MHTQHGLDKPSSLHIILPEYCLPDVLVWLRGSFRPNLGKSGSKGDF